MCFVCEILCCCGSTKDRHKEPYYGQKVDNKAVIMRKDPKNDKPLPECQPKITVETKTKSYKDEDKPNEELNSQTSESLATSVPIVTNVDQTNGDNKEQFSDVQFIDSEDNNASRVMVNDIVINVLSRLSVRQQISLEKVSKQFLDCVDTALKTKRLLSVGHQELIDSDITAAIVRKEEVTRQDYDHKIIIFWYDLTASHLVLQSLLGKCSLIESLSLRKFIIDYPTVALIMNLCPRLKILTIDSFDIKSGNTTANQWTQLLSKQLIRLSIDTIPRGIYRQILNNLSELLNLKDFEAKSNYFLANQVLSHIPAHIRCLTIQALFESTEDFDAMDQFIARIGHQLEVLDINIMFEDNEENPQSINQVLITICRGCPTLKKLTIKSFTMDSNAISQYISKLKSLEELSIISTLTLNVNTIQVMPSLRRLTLKYTYVSPSEWTRVAIIWPNVRRVTLDYPTYIRCECGQHLDDEDNLITDCQCLEWFFKCLSYLPSLERLDNKWMNWRPILYDNDIFEPFIEINTLCLNNCFQDINQLVAFCMKCMDSRVSPKPLKLILDQQMADQLMETFDEMGLNSKSISIYRYRPPVTTNPRRI